MAERTCPIIYMTNLFIYLFIYLSINLDVIPLFLKHYMI